MRDADFITNSKGFYLEFIYNPRLPYDEWSNVSFGARFSKLSSMSFDGIKRKKKKETWKNSDIGCRDYVKRRAYWTSKVHISFLNMKYFMGFSNTVRGWAFLCYYNIQYMIKVNIYAYASATA